MNRVCSGPRTLEVLTPSRVPCRRCSRPAGGGAMRLRAVLLLGIVGSLLGDRNRHGCRAGSGPVRSPHHPWVRGATACAEHHTPTSSTGAAGTTASTASVGTTVCVAGLGTTGSSEVPVTNGSSIPASVKVESGGAREWIGSPGRTKTPTSMSTLPVTVLSQTGASRGSRASRSSSAPCSSMNSTARTQTRGSSVSEVATISMAAAVMTGSWLEQARTACVAGRGATSSSMEHGEAG